MTQPQLKPISRFCPQTLAVCLLYGLSGTMAIYDFEDGRRIAFDSPAIINNITCYQGKIVGSWTSRQVKGMSTESLTHELNNAWHSQAK